MVRSPTPSAPLDVDAGILVMITDIAAADAREVNPTLLVSGGMIGFGSVIDWVQKVEESFDLAISALTQPLRNTR